MLALAFHHGGIERFIRDPIVVTVLYKEGLRAIIPMSGLKENSG